MIISTSYEGCITSIIEAVNLLTNLGFVLHVEKSIFFPQQRIVFLGFELNSATMKIKLTNEKITKMSRISYILNSERYTIREVAQIIGHLVSSFPAVRYGECHYRVIEHDKIEALKIAKGNFDKYMQLSTRSIEELNWWLLNLLNWWLLKILV